MTIPAALEGVLNSLRFNKLDEDHDVYMLFYDPPTNLIELLQDALGMFSPTGELDITFIKPKKSMSALIMLTHVDR